MKSNIFKIFLASLCIMFLAGNHFANGQTKAFPTAEGYGKYATGGRGGEVIEVTNLEDYGENETPVPGSFRWAFTQAPDSSQNRWGTWIRSWKPITIVFRVGGIINLKRELRIQRDNMTIAGQTAPGGGICFGGNTLNFSASNNLIVRYLRSRPGDIAGEEVSAFRIENGSRFIIDHCSFSWAIEETTHFSSNDSTTVQWCIISESLYDSFHKKGARGYGTQWGGEYASYHHNLLADHNSRMPRINGSNANDVNALVDYRNNINFNWSSAGAFYGGEWEGTGSKGFCHTNVVNNYFKPGPSLAGTARFASPSYNRDDVTVSGYGKWYFNGNVMEGNQSMSDDNWLGVDASGVGGANNIRSNEEFVFTDGILEDYDEYTQTAAEAFSSVLENAGASFPERDSHDTRVIEELKGEIDIVRYRDTILRIGDAGDTTRIYSPVKGVNAGIIDTQDNLVSPEDREAGITAWSVYTPSTNAPADADHDGMPDSWEQEHGLNSNDAEDAKTITESGYSNLEVYLNNLVGETAPVSAPKIKTTAPLQIFPNPCTDKVLIQSGDDLKTIEFYNVNGKKVLSVAGSGKTNTVQTDKLGIGIYLIKAITNDGNMVQNKLIKME